MTIYLICRCQAQKLSSLLRSFSQTKSSPSQAIFNGFKFDNLVLPSATIIQQQGYKKFLRTRKIVVPPLDFKSGDLVQQEELPQNELLYIYRDIKDLENAPEELRKLFTVEFAKGNELIQHRHMEVQNRISNIVGAAQGPEKYIGFLTVKIRNLMLGCNRFRQDKRAKVVCKEMIEKRTKLLKNLSRRDYDRFLWLLKELKIEYRPKNPKTMIKLSKKDVVRKAAADEVEQKKAEKMQALRERFVAEKEKFMEHKKNILEEIERDIEQYNLDRDKIIQNYKDYLESLKPKPKVKPYCNTYEVPKKYRNK